MFNSMKMELISWSLIVLTGLCNLLSVSTDGNIRKSIGRQAALVKKFPNNTWTLKVVCVTVSHN